VKARQNNHLKKAQGLPNVFDEMGSYWKEIADENFTKQQIRFIKDTVGKDGLVLDLACGTGRHTIPLSKEGYGVVGLDVSLKLLKIAHERSPQVQIVKGDMRYLPFNGEVFSAAVSMDTSFGYLPSETADLQSLIELHKTLRQGGLLILDVFNQERIISKYRLGLKRRVANSLKWWSLPILLSHNRLARKLLFLFFNWKEYPSFFLLQKRTVSADGKELCDLWVVYDKATGQMRLFRHSVHLYELSQLKGLLEKAGFAVKDQYGSYSREAYSADSSRLIVLANTK
jgi:SAM-dependent methyltransferase